MVKGAKLAVLVLCCIIAVKSIDTDLDTEERRVALIKKFFKDGKETLTKFEATQLFNEYFLDKTIDVVDKIKYDIKDDGESDKSLLDDGASITLVDLWLEAQGDALDNLNAETTKKKMNFEDLMAYAAENVNVVLERMMRLELDRQGIQDPQKRENMLKQMNEMAEGGLEKILNEQTDL